SAKRQAEYQLKNFSWIQFSMAIEPFNFFINEVAGDEPVFAKAKSLMGLDKVWKKIAPDILQTMHISHIDDNRLYLASPNGAVAAYARQSAPSLLRAFNNEAHSFKSIIIEVKPYNEIKKTKKRIRGNIPKKALDTLMVLKTLLEEGELKEALDRLLARHTEI
ncbi:MAG TPA: DciA family protein, partial [Burkholderiales bacterium]|nr:DciA family protein [Burkholderiales bacterium]